MIIDVKKVLVKVTDEDITGGRFVIPDGVTHIGKEAFRNRKGLEEVEVPESVTYIGLRAFCGCRNLSRITIPKFVEHIANGAFSGCTSLMKINIPYGVKFIGYSFFGCSGIQEITIPASVENLDGNAFNGCTGLREIQLERPDASYCIHKPLNTFEFTAFISSSRMFRKGLTVSKAQRFGGIVRGSLRLHSCFVVEQGGVFAYGETRKLAMAELRFNQVRGRSSEMYRDISPEAAIPFDEMMAMYRIIAKAYLPDTAEFVQKLTWPKDTYSAYEMAEKTRGQFGNGKFARFFGIEHKTTTVCPALCPVH